MQVSITDNTRERHLLRFFNFGRRAHRIYIDESWISCARIDSLCYKCKACPCKLTVSERNVCNKLNCME